MTARPRAAAAAATAAAATATAAAAAAAPPPGAPRDALLDVLCRIARMAAESLDRLSRIERDRRQRGEALEALLLPALASALDTREVFQRLAAAAQQVIPHDVLALGMLSEDRTRVRLYASPPFDAAADLPEIPLNE